MTTASTATVVDHTSDAGFRTWGLENSTQLAAVGLVQTGDTGQINWVTVTRPAVSTSGGYEIWRFVDSTLYMKFEYGTGTSATAPQMWITVGTGSNGTGTLTGQLSTRNIFTANAVPASTATLYTSRWCRIADAFAMSWKETGVSATSHQGFLCVGKTVDGTGTATTTGFGVLRDNNAAANSIALQSVRIVATATTFTESSQTPPCICFPGAPTSSTASGNSQAYEFFLNVPDVQPFCWAAGVIISELTRGTTMTVAMVGSATHTYCGTGQMSANGFSNYVTGTYGIAYIFE